jgi:hypothetical protein
MVKQHNHADDPIPPDQTRKELVPQGGVLTPFRLCAERFAAARRASFSPRIENE